MKRRHRQHAFTLIEAIIAVVILTVAFPPMLWAIRESHIKRISPMMVSKARWLATEKLEDIIADRHSSTRGYAYLVTANYPAEGSIAGYPGFTRSVSFSETTVNLSTAGTGYMKVTVSVSWTDAGGAFKTLAVTTVLTSYS